jgi:beta-lactam-binding protein with PASTA domain
MTIDLIPYGFNYDINGNFNTVLGQSPAPGTAVAVNAPINLDVAEPPMGVVYP